MSKNARKKILLAEDDYAIALALKTILQNNIDCDLTVTHNGQEAWDALLETKFDLILCDWNMPIKTGCELLNDVKLNLQTKHIPFVMLTARADKSSIIEALKTGVTDYIHKPFDRANLIEKIQNILVDTERSANDDSSAQNQAVTPKPRKIVTQIAAKLRDEDYTLPMLSDMANTAQKMLKEDDASINDVATIIKTDLGITTRLIALSNNVFYRGISDNHTLEEAITRLGLTETMNFLWVFSTVGLFKSNNSIFNGFLQQIRDHSMATAEAAKCLAQCLCLDNSEDFYYMGLIHDIGVILVIQIFEDLSKTEDLPDQSAIYQAIDELHGKFGSVLLDRWKMPKIMQEVALYHDDLESADSIGTELYVINFADRLAQQLGYCMEYNKDDTIDLLELASARHLGIDTEVIDELTDKVNQHVKSVVAML